MEKYIISAIFAVLTIFSSCTIELVDIESKLTTIKASISDESSTKTTISDDTGENGSRVKIYWSQGDNIKLTFNSNSYIFSFQGADHNMVSADFSTDSNLPDLNINDKIIAEYPGTGKPDLSRQYGILESLSRYHYMTAEYTVTDDNYNWEDLSLSFKTQTPIMKFTLRNEDFIGQTIENIQFYIGNNLIVSSINSFTGSHDKGEFTAYFVIDPQELNGDGYITAICNGKLYEASIISTTMLTAGKLYRVDKVMNASDVNMKYSNSKAIISVNSSASPATVVSYVYRALSEGIIHISLEGAVSDDIKYAVNEVLVDIQYNAILSFNNTKTFYVFDEEGFRAWGEAAESDKRANCTLINDIVLTSDWEFFIGKSNDYYKGILDGRNHSISGLSINQDAVRLQYFNPLALISYSSGEIKNLIIEGGSCICTDTYIIKASLIVSGNKGIIDGVHVRSNSANKNVYFKNISPTITSYHVGVIAADNSGVIKNCTNELPVKIFLSENADLYAGGIVADNVNYIVQCINDGDIETEGGLNHYIGGIVGNAIDSSWDKVKIYLCANRAKAKGGIIGFCGTPSGSLVGNYTTCSNLIYNASFSPSITNCYTTDDNFGSSKYYISSIYNVYENMNTAVENLQCEHIDKRWGITNGYLELEAI